MAVNRDQVMRRILTEIGRDELRRVRFLIGSATLRKAVELIIEVNLDQARLFIPHYWAEFYHDGRRGFSAGGSSKLVFFANPKDDPRAPTARRQAGLRRLTKEEFTRGLEINRKRRKAGGPPFMFVLDRVGPSPARPFFDNLAQGAAARAGQTIQRIFDEEIQDAIDSDPDLRARKGTATFRIQ